MIAKSNKDFSVITIAVGKKIYVDMACNLAMSFLLWNDITSINFFLITDSPDFIPEQLKGRINVIHKTAIELGSGFASKLLIGELLQTKFTIFIDSDCLVYGKLDVVFTQFGELSVSAIGYSRYEGKDVGFCNDIKDVMQKSGIDYFPLLCGSLYYVKKDKISHDLFQAAKAMLITYDDLGLVRLRGKENEEPLIAIAMARHNQITINDTGLIKADRMFYDFLDTNVIEGRAKLWNGENAPVPEYSMTSSAAPLIVHFNASFSDTFEYKSEVIRLRKYFLCHYSKKRANIHAYLTSELPGKLEQIVKLTFRPFYNRLFGYRKIKNSNRL